MTKGINEVVCSWLAPQPELQGTSAKSWAATKSTGSPDYVRGLQRAGYVSYSCAPKNIPMRTESALARVARALLNPQSSSAPYNETCLSVAPGSVGHRPSHIPRT